MSESIEYKGYTITIEQDETPEDPRDMDQFGHMICFHRRYNLGDKHQWSSPTEFEEEVLNTDKNANTPKGNVIALPLFLYDHSGITMNTAPFSCKWDSGQVGWIYMTKEEALKNWNWKRLSKKRVDHVLDVLRNYVKWYDEYLRGEVYGYVVSHPEIGDHLDSCWGYFGDPASEGGAIDSAKEVVDWHVEQEIKAEEFVRNSFAL
jgi:hypothetical protein